MAAAAQGVWAIDLGSNALKALQIDHGENGLEVLDFAYLEHSKNLVSSDVTMEEKEQILVETLRQFLDEKDLSKSDVAISIAGQNSFARFIKLPPVEPKKIPEVVQFEAVQQIPFDINEVEWDWQLMEAEDSPDKTVGLFAIKNELIAEVMDHFTNENLRVSCVQIAPMALYNYACYDLKELQQSPDKATIILDMGSDNTTLVVCTKDSVWQRSIRIGGNTFTEAIADTFRKNFKTAEKLKRTAPMSKYMRQIYTAMKSVYTDLGSEIQRSLGFYSSSPEGRNKTFTKVIALGGGVKLQGLSKYLTQTLGVQVVKPDSFETLSVAEGVSSAKFHENLSDFGIAYGLGVQLLDEAKISTNLLPRKIARAMAWNRKARIFTIAASVLLFVMLLALGKAFKDLKQYNSYRGTRSQIQQVVSEARDISSSISEQENRVKPLEEDINKITDRFKHRDTVPVFVETLAKCLPNKENNPQNSELYAAFESGNVDALAATPRQDRKLLFVTRFAMEFSRQIDEAGFPEPEMDKYTGGGLRGPGAAQMPAMPMMGMEQMKMVMPEMMMGGTGPAEVKEKVGGPGFTILIEGYSPYKNIAELLDPPNVRSDQSRWGLVTRLEKLSELFPGIPFELYGKHDIAHFKVETGLVDLEIKDMPKGIGILKEVERMPQEAAQPQLGFAGGAMGIGGMQTDYVKTEKVLIDPMTGEEICKTFDIYTQRDIDRDPELTDRDLGRKKYSRLTGDPMYIERDNWYRIQAKFLWKDAPEDPYANPDAAGGGGMGMMGF